MSLASIAFPQAAEASHFRYGHVTWKALPITTNRFGQTRYPVDFTVTVAFRRGDASGNFSPSAPRGSAPDGLLAVGDTFTDNIGATGIRFGDFTQESGLTFLVVAIDPEKNFVIARGLDPISGRDRVRHEYAAPNDFGLPWEADVVGCCRISNLQNNADGSYRVMTEVDLTQNSFSAVSSLPPIIPVPRTGTRFVIPGIDPEGHRLNYRLATAVEASSFFGGFVQVPGVSINATSGELTVPPLAPGLYSVHIVIEELDSTDAKVGQVALDFILDVQAQVTGTAPVFVAPTPGNNSTVTAIVGKRLVVPVAARDADGDQVKLNTTGGPIGTTFSPALPTLSTTNVSGSMVWRPTLEDVGAYSVTFTVEDSNGNFTFTTVNIRVIEAIRVLEPNGNETYLAGDSVTVAWLSQGGQRSAGVRIFLSSDGGQSFNTELTPSGPVQDTGTFTWQVNSPPGQRYRIRVVNEADPADFDESDLDFTITNGVRRTLCTAPNVTPVPIADNLGDPQNQADDWAEMALDFVDPLVIRGLRVTVNISHPHAGDLQLFLVHPNASATPALSDMILLQNQTGERQADINTTYGHGLAFTAPVEALNKFNGRKSAGRWRLRARDLNPGDVGQINAFCLTITGPIAGTFQVTSPNGGENLAISVPSTITWNSSNVAGNVDVQLSRDGGASWTTLFPNTANDGSETWTPTGPPVSTARIRVVSTEEPVLFDDSDANFSIVTPFLTVVTPNGGERLAAGQQYEIRWIDAPAQGTVAIEFSRDGGSTWTTIDGATPDDGSFMWTPPTGQDTTRGRIRITANAAPARSDISDRDFILQTPGLLVTSPNGGDVWYTFTTKTITWQSIGLTDPVRIELFRNGVWEDVVTRTTNDGSETITVSGPAAADAKVRISSANDASINDESDTAFEIRETSIRVVAPNGGESWPIGTTQTIRWASDGVPGNVDILISRDGGQSFTTVFGNTPNDGSQDWTVTGPAGSQVIIRIKASDLPTFDVSDAVFHIVQPGITVLAPNTSTGLRVGQRAVIEWSSEELSGNVNVELSRDGGATYEPLFMNTANDGTEVWTVTGPASSQALIRVSSVALPGVLDTSDVRFPIVVPGVSVISPNGGETWRAGTTQTITWSGVGFDENVRIELTRDGGTSWETLVASTPNDGTEVFTVTGPGTDNARVRITSLNPIALADESNSPFRIEQPALILGNPNGGQNWLIGSTQTITWSGTAVDGAVDIDISVDGGLSWARIFTGIANDGAEPWTVTGPASTSVKFRVLSSGNPDLQDSSDGLNSIGAPTLQVLAPGRDAKWRVGSRQTITWTGSVLSSGGTVDIQISRNGGRTFQTIIQDTENDGSATWFVTGGAAKRAKIRVVWKPDQSVQDDSDGTLEITASKSSKKKKKKNRR